MQLPYQLADSCAITGYVFVVTLLILIVMDFIPGLSLRVSENAEEAGIDASEIGELAYDYAHPAKEVRPHR
jgi:Amt family ammonium transporter